MKVSAKIPEGVGEGKRKTKGCGIIRNPLKIDNPGTILLKPAQGPMLTTFVYR